MPFLSSPWEREPSLKKWQLIDLIRSFSIIVIMALHVNRFLVAPENPFWRDIWQHLQEKGDSGVFLFFIVSGFLISRVIAENPGGLLRPDLRRFYIQRAGRILPLLLVTVLWGTALILTKDHTREFLFFYSADDKNPLFWLSLLFFSFNWWGLTPKVFDVFGLHWLVLWSLSVEEQFYFLFPISLKKMGSKKRLTLFLFLVVAFALPYRLGAYFYDPNNPLLQHGSSFALFDLIAAGILTYLASERYRRVLAGNRKLSLALFVSGFALLAFTYWASFPVFFSRVFGYDLLELGMAGVLLGGIHLPFFDLKYLSILSYPGKYCYCNYLIHPTVLYFTYPILHGMNVFLALAVFVGSTTVISALSYNFFEMPANRAIRKAFYPQAATKPVVKRRTPRKMGTRIRDKKGFVKWAKELK